MFLIVLLFAIDVYSQCPAAYLEPLYICNYKRQPRITKLIGYEKKFLWFRKEIKYTDGWRQIDFEDPLIVRSRHIGEKVGSRVNRSYNFLSKNEINYTHFQINFNCNDVLFENQPTESVKIFAADADFCKKYPENSLIEIKGD